MKILIIGDVVGRSGRNVLKDQLENLEEAYQADFIIVNGENASSGTGIIQKHADGFFDMGISAITTGNHVWDKKETEAFIDAYPNLLRPANYPSPCPGNGFTIIDHHGINVAVINLSGRTYMRDLDCPFRKLDQILEDIPDTVKVKVLDFHGEATAEKLAMGYYASKRVSIVFGTHTHVQTSDSRILDDYTGYITDVGMTGPLDGILGVDKDIILKGFLTQRPIRHELAKGPRQINGLLAEVDDVTGRCLSLEAFLKIYE